MLDQVDKSRLTTDNIFLVSLKDRGTESSETCAILIEAERPHKPHCEYHREERQLHVIIGWPQVAGGAWRTCAPSFFCSELLCRAQRLVDPRRASYWTVTSPLRVKPLPVPCEYQTSAQLKTARPAASKDPAAQINRGPSPNSILWKLRIMSLLN